ncbi:MAG: hypothetical protein FIB01_13010 [Gemmatimonadetes bacterium]|nr:hypothetical protein [Gemmatimonadota bacterium]
MSVLMWAVLALLGGLAVVWVGGRRAQPAREPLPEGVELPATARQRAAWGARGAGLLLSGGAAAGVIVNGPDRTYEDDGVRLLFTALVLAAVAAAAGVTMWAKRPGAKAGALDERDQAILAQAPAAQAVAVLVTLAIWTVGLTERFHGAGAVPVFYLYLLFWSCLLVNLLAEPVGILAGYRRS